MEEVLLGSAKHLLYLTKLDPILHPKSRLPMFCRQKIGWNSYYNNSRSTLISICLSSSNPFIILYLEVLNIFFLRASFFLINCSPNTTATLSLLILQCDVSSTTRFKSVLMIDSDSSILSSLLIIRATSELSNSCFIIYISYILDTITSTYIKLHIIIPDLC